MRESIAYGPQPDTPTVSGCGTASTWTDVADRSGHTLAADAASLRARPHQFVAAGGWRGLDDCRHGLRIGQIKRLVGADFWRAACRIAGDAGRRDPLSSRPYRLGRLVDRALANSVVGFREGKGLRAGGEARRRRFFAAAARVFPSRPARPGRGRGV